MKRCILTVLMAATLLAGCAAPAEKAPSGPALAEPAQETGPNFESQRQLSCVTAAGEKGMYLCESFWPFSCSLLYLDFETRQEVFLCTQPNCSHSTDSCPAFISLEGGRYPPIVLTAGGRVLLLRTGASGDMPSGLQAADADGGNLKDLIRLPASENMGSQLYFDGEWLYYNVIVTTIQNGEPVSEEVLRRVQLDTGEQQEVMTIPKGRSLFTCVGDCLVLDGLTETAHAFYYLHPESGFVEKKPFYEATNSETGAFVKDGKVYSYTYADNTFTCLDLATGCAVSVDCSSCFEGRVLAGAPSVSCLAAPDLARLEYSEDLGNGKRRHVMHLIDLRTGALSPEFTLATAESGKTASLHGVWGDTYFVAVGWPEFDAVVQTEAGMQTVTLSATEYAAISKDDYFVSVPNFSPVEGVRQFWN